MAATTSHFRGRGDPSTPAAARGRPAPRIFGVGGRELAAVLLGWFFVVFDGYDLIVYGTVQGQLMRQWHLGPTQAGLLGSTAFIGMAIGAFAIGQLSDRVGRSAAVIGSVAVLSVFTQLCAFAPNPWVFGALRLFAGFGLGGLVPSVNAMVADIVPLRTLSTWSTVMMSGVPIGGSVAALLAAAVLPGTSGPEYSGIAGWRVLFLIAVVPIVLGLPLAAWLFPRDRRRGQAPTPPTVERAARGGFGAILVRRYRAVTLLVAVATFVTLLAWYGLGTWLPKLPGTTSVPPSPSPWR